MKYRVNAHENSTSMVANTFHASLDPFPNGNHQSTELIIRDLPPTLRYLSKNKGSPKEHSLDMIHNIRSMFYAQLSIDSKKDETLKLREYIIME